MIVLSAPAALSATFNVTKTADTSDGACDADCSLREAITAANADGTGDTINVPAGTYTLTRSGSGEDGNSTGDLDISNPVNISGAGSGSTIIQAGTTGANGIDRVFHVTNASAVTLQGVTVRYGRASNGGCIYNNSGTLTIDNSTIDTCYANDKGAGIYNLTSTITMTGDIVFTSNDTQRNATSDHGGAIWTTGGITHSGGTITFENNDAWQGGAIYVNDATKTISLNAASFINNRGNSIGGAIRSYGLTITGGATFTDNYSNDSGGAIYNSTGDIAITGDAIFTNNDSYRNATSDHGGAIWTSGNITHSGGAITFENNDAWQGGAIYINDSTKTISLNAASFINNTGNGIGGAMRSYGVTITGGATFTDNYSNDAGGAIYNSTGDIEITGDATFTNNDSYRNSTSDHGGAIRTTGNITITDGNLRLENNDAWSGGAFYVNGGSVTVTNGSATFLTNTANGSGGAIWVSGSLSIPNGLTATGNTANDIGGTIYSNGLTITGGATVTDSNSGDGEAAVHSNGANAVSIDGNIDFSRNSGGGIKAGGNVTLNPTSGSSLFHQNTNATTGGAIYAAGSVSVASPIFTENTTIGSGGAVRCSGLTITGGATFTDNYANDSGGAIYNSAGDVSIDGNASFTNNDSYRNATTDHGGAVWAGGDFFNTNGSIEFVNNDAWNGGAVYMDTGAFTAETVTCTNNTANGSGGCILSRGLTISNGATFTDNRAPSNDGGAIYNTTNPVSINGTILFDNNDAGTGADDWGGAIYSSADVTLNDVAGSSTFQNSRAYEGGAIFMNSGTTLTIKNATFDANRAENHSGAIRMYGGTLTDVTFTNNYSASADGGAIYNSTNQLTIDGTSNTFTNNYGSTGSTDEGGTIRSSGPLTIANAAFTGRNDGIADAYNGGAIFVVDTGDVVTISDSSFASFRAENVGGAIRMYGGTLTNVIFTDNISNSADGGAIYNSTNQLTIDGTSNTFTNNYGSTGSGDEGGTIRSTGPLSIANAAFTGRNDGTADAYDGGAIFVADTGDVVTISDSSFASFKAENVAGAIRMYGGALTNVTFTDNISNSNDGGAIYNSTNTLTIDGTNSFTNNKATGGDDWGGAIRSSGSLTISGTSFSQNTAYEGGAIYITDLDTLTLTDCSFDSNTAAHRGGAIRSWGGTITSSTFSNNSTTGGGHDGGALYSSKPLYVYNSTFSGNSAGDQGGAIRQSSDCTIKNSTFSNNSATTGEAIYSGGSCTMYNSIVTKSSASSSLCTGVTSGDYNIQYNGSCFTAQANDQTTDPGLAALADNGGPTKTHALQVLPPISPAVDAGLNSVCTDADVAGVDQRGETRPTKGRFSTTCDIGAFEYIPLPETVTGTASAANNGDTKVDISMPYTEDGNFNSTYAVEYKLSTSGTWLDWGTNPKAHTLTPFTDTVSGLTPGKDYNLRLTYNDTDGVSGTNPQFVDITTLLYDVDLTPAGQTVEESAGTVTLTATLSNVSGATVTVPFTVSGTAIGGGTDHNLADGNITITAGQLTGTTTFSVTDDTDDEPEETVIVTMGSPVNAAAGTVTVHTVTIRDNDNEPHTPVNQTPANGATDVSRTPTLTSSAFGDTEGDAHQASQWRIATDSGFTSLVYDSGPILDLESHTVTGTLDLDTTYYWQVRHQDDLGNWSYWSYGTAFTTLSGHIPEYSPDASGYIRDWLLLGPLTASSCSDITRSYLDESTATPNDGDGPVGGKNWGAHHDTDNYINLSSIFGGTNVLAYAVVYVYSPSNRSAQLRLGSDDSVAAWLNGTQVHENGSCRGAAVDQDIVAVTLNQGWNRLLVKVVNGSSGWGLYCRFTDTGGTPMTDLDLSLTYNGGTASPDKPDNTSPADGSTGVSLTPTLAASAFADSDGDAHRASRWQIRPADVPYGEASMYDSGGLTTDLTSHQPITADWVYERTVSLAPATPVDNYQIRLLLTADTFDYNHAKSAGADLRFFTSSGDPLSYWIERWNTSGTSTIWVKVNDAGTTAITMRYGNEAATADSDGFATFDFFDDFDDGELNSPSWSSLSGTWTVTGGALQSSSTGHPVIAGDEYRGSDFIMEGKIRYTANLNEDSDQAWLTFRLQNENKFYGYGSRTNDSLYHWEVRRRDNSTTWAELGQHTLYPASMDQWYKQRVQVAGTAIKASMWLAEEADPESWDIEVTDSTYSEGLVGLKGTSSTATVQFDDIFVRKYNATVPVASLGAESTIAYPFTFTGGGQYFWRVQYQDDTGRWSSWSFETGFTTRGNVPPYTPAASSPTGAVTARYVTLASAAFADDDVGETHRASQWRISTVSGDYSGQELVHDSDAVDSLTSYSLTNALTASTTYYWQVRHQDSGTLWSNWSPEASFTTDADLPPLTPTNASPADGAGGISRTPTLSGSAFSDQPDNLQQASQWQVSTASGAGFEAAVVHDSWTVDDKTSHTVTTSLELDTTYYWRVRYQDVAGQWSAWSADTSFTTTPASPDGMLHHWKLDTGSGVAAYDSVGTEHGEITNATWTTGISGSALNFDGSGDYITFSDFTVPESFTVTMWVNPANTNNGQAFIGKNDGSGGNIFLVGYWNDGLEVYLRGASNASGAKTTGWQHIGVVVEKINATDSIVSVFRDGSILWRKTFDTVLGTTTGKAWTLGQEWDGGSRTDYYNGKMNDVIIFDRVLTDSEIREIYSDSSYFHAPDQPTNTSPADGATDSSTLPTLTASAFSDSDADTHTASQWRVRPAGAAYGNLVSSYDSGVRTDDLVSHTLPGDKSLTAGTQYYWQVKYRDSGNDWSAWSAETSFTVRSNTPPDKPDALSPAGGALVTNPRPSLSSAAFSDPDVGEVHVASQWRISTVSGSFVAPGLVYDSDRSNSSLTTHALTSDLSQSTAYYWQVRHLDSGGAWSPWSDEADFVTASNLAPDQPTTLSPANSIGDISLTPTLTASSFSDVDGGDTHQASQWQVSTDTGANFTAGIVYDTGAFTDLTAHTVGSTLANDTTHYWRVRYQDSAGNWSYWSEEASFITELSLLDAIKLHWKFDETGGSVAYDTAGNHDGSVTQAVWTEGKHNGALVFDGYDDRVTTSFPSWTPTSFAVEFWINPWECTSDNQQRIYSGWDYFYFHTNADCSIYVGVRQADRFAPETEAAFFGALDLNEWQHFIFTYAGGTGSFYKNGSLLGSKSMNSPKAWTSFKVGRTQQYTIHGKVDEVIVYTRALTADEVQERYDAAGAFQSANPPEKPNNSSPSNGATNVSVTPTLAASAFSDIDGDNHIASRWQFRKDGGSYGDAGSFDTQATSAALTSFTVAAPPSWAAAGWTKRREISLSTATTVADYQVKVELSPHNFDYSDAKSGGADLRFYSAGGALLNHYIEEWDTSGTSTVWIKIADPGTSKIYMYYGNSGAGSTSDAEAVFDLFDGFDGAGLDTAKWDVMNTDTTSVSGGILTIASGGTWWNNADTATAIVSKSSFGTNFVAETKLYDISKNNHSRFFGLRSSVATDARMMVLKFDDNRSHIGYNWRDADGASADGSGSNTGVVNKRWPRILARFVKNGDTVTGFVDGATVGSRTVASWGLEKVALTNTHSATDPFRFDWIRVRKYMATEPVAAVGRVTTPTTTSMPLEYGTTYYWHVQYQDDTGLWSEFSSETSFATINDPATPAAPTGLSATAVPPCRIDLAWTDASDNETGFRVERKIGAGGAYAAIATLDAGTENYSDTSGLAINETHYYKVYAVNSGGDSSASNEDSAGTTSITYYRDDDGDTYGDGAVSQAACSAPDGYVTDDTDCDDTDSAINPATVWYLDADGDSYSTGATLTQCDDPGDTYFIAADLAGTAGDCDDGDATVHPALVWFKDMDGDLYSDGTTKTQCTVPAGYHAAGDLTAVTGDCDDGDAAIRPGAGEVCDGVDNDCDDEVDEGLAADQTYYRDADSDTYGDAATSTDTCLGSPPAGYVANSSDCDDDSGAIRPGATEYCNGIDDDCDDVIDESCIACESTPSAPTGLDGGATNSLVISLNWTDNSTCEEGFELEVRLWNGEWLQRATTGPGVTTFTDTVGIMPETTYTYRVRSFIGSNMSAYSNEKEITTPAFTPGDSVCE